MPARETERIRIRALGGCFRLEGQPGQGTHLDATFLLSVSYWPRRRTRQPAVTRLRRRGEDIPLDAGAAAPADPGGRVRRRRVAVHQRSGHPGVHLLVLATIAGCSRPNVTPLVRREVIVGCGPNLVAVLDGVPGLLDTGTLRALDARVELAGQSPRLVAGSWLRAQGLIPAGVTCVE